jgi:hypothetical protein
MIWLSVNRDFFISVDPFRWKKFYFSALRIFGGITNALASLSGKEMPVKSNKNSVFPSRTRLENLWAVEECIARRGTRMISTTNERRV